MQPSLAMLGKGGEQLAFLFLKKKRELVKNTRERM
jgi:hypothetical protein